MNVETLSVPVEQAREAFQHYQAAVKLRHDKEDIAIMRGYEQIIKGNSVINLHTAFQNVECFDHNGFPKLAICAAQFDKVWCQTERSIESCRFGWVRVRKNKWQRDGELSRSNLNSIVVPLPEDENRDKNTIKSTMVPLIPPQYRPARLLKSHYILWEVESWTPEPPVDPMLLKHLGGAMYAVLATWDLTPIERAVLAETRG